jgi:hypothetical protein
MQSRLLFLQQAAPMQGDDDDTDDAVRDRLVPYPPVLQPPSRSALTGICYLPFSKPRPICSKGNSVAVKPQHSSVISQYPTSLLVEVVAARACCVQLLPDTAQSAS